MSQANSSPPHSPFHEGEIALQRSVGMAERMERFGSKVIREFMPDQHRDFYGQLPFIVAATVDDAGDVWPTILAGAPGFMSSPTPSSLKIGAMPDVCDPARQGARAGGAIGMLGIELHTRRRNRVNGTIRDAADGSLQVEVRHAFGNCPQYIQLRDFAFAHDPAVPHATEVEDTDSLTEGARAIISAADTFFVASYADQEGERQVDASHRGGRPGFVRIDEEGQLTIPDFSGNFHFNTLGNFIVNPRAGLLFVDFETGDILQLAGTARVITDSPEISAFEGAKRIWTFRPRRVVLRRDASALRWQLREDGFSPRSLMTGSWEEVAAQLGDGGIASPEIET